VSFSSGEACYELIYSIYLYTQLLYFTLHAIEWAWFQIAALMIALFVGSWLPYCLVAMFGIVGLGHLVTPYSAELPVMLAKASAVWNPIVYALMHPRYRSALAERLPRVVTDWCHLGASDDNSNTPSIHDVDRRQTTTAAAAAAGGTAGVCKSQEIVEMKHVEMMCRRQSSAVTAAGDDF